MNAIVCVDDDILTSRLLRSEISKYEIPDTEVYSEISPENALKRIESLKDSVKLLISDSTMPGMSGQQLLKIVSEKYPSVKQIMISGYALEDLKNSVSDCEVFVKPWNKQKLKSYIISVVA